MPLAAACVVTATTLMWTHASASSVTAITVPSLDSAPTGVAAGASGSVWFVESTGSAVGRIDSSGSVTEFGVPADSTGIAGSLNSITAGPDGAMWFTDPTTFAPRIGRVDASGKVTLFDLPMNGTPGFSGAEPLRIIDGPDGALWFAAGSVIGRIDTSGRATAYAVPQGGFARGVTTGPDHAIWFTQTTPDALGRLDPATGHITEHPLTSASGSVLPDGIVAGPDGALWFTENGLSRIGRFNVSTGGLITTATPTAGSGPIDIVSGPGPALWFTEGAAGNIGRITLGRKVTEYPLGGNLAGPIELSRAAGGSLWVAEAGANRIARIDTAAPPSGAPNKAVDSGGQAPAAFEMLCPKFRLCSTQVTTGGTFKVKSFTQPLPPGAIRLTGYLVTGSGQSLVLKPPLAGQELASKPVPVQGGLLGTIPLLGPIVGPISGPENDLSISLTLAGTVVLTFGTELDATVPITLHLNNALLGSNCTIGPVVQHLAITPTSTGISDPAMFWNAESTVGSDNLFSVPGAQGCGAVPLVFDQVIDQQLGLPSASGNNAASLPAILSIGVGVHP